MAGHPQGVLQGIPHSRSKRTKQALKSPRASQPALPAAFLQRKTLRPELCAANFRQGFRKLHVPTVASLSVLRLCGESFACTQLRPMRVPLFGHSVSYVADSRPPRAHHTFPVFHTPSQRQRTDRVRAARARDHGAQCGHGGVDESEYSVGSRVASYAYRQTCFSLIVRSQDETRVHNIRLYGNTTKLAFNAPPHKRPGLCA